MATRIWVDRETLRVNRVSAKRDPPIVVQVNNQRPHRYTTVELVGLGRMVYDAGCSACASVYLEVDDDQRVIPR